MSFEQPIQVRLVGFAEMIDPAQQSETSSEQVRLERWGPPIGVAALYLSAYQGEALGEPVGSDRGAVSMFLCGRFPRSAPPNRTCGFHRIRLSAGRLGMDAQRCSLVWISSTRAAASSDVGHGTLVFTGDLLVFQSHRC